MQRLIPITALFILASSLLTGCGLIEGIFKAGMWTGILIVVAILALIIWIIAKLAGGKRN